MTYTIHHYPAHLIDVVTTDDGRRITLRPVLPQDAVLLQDYVQSLSSEARYMRFMRGLRELSPGMLTELTSVDYQMHVALIATVAIDGVETIIAEAHYVADEQDALACEFALSVADDWQRRGLGVMLVERLARDAAAAGFRRI